MDDSEKFKELVRQSRIASLLNGNVDVKPSNLQAILDRVSDSDKDMPVVLVAVIGPKFSGKSFLTNFMIQFVNQKGDGGWMSQITSRTKANESMMELGYAWNSVQSEHFFRGEKGVGGIYMWPKPLMVTKPITEKTEKRLAVWILHIDIHDMEDESTEPLEKFLALACSSVVEILWNNKNINLLEFPHQIPHNLPYPIAETDFCQIASFIIRSGENVPKGLFTGEDAKTKLLETVADEDQRRVYMEILDKHKEVNLVHLPDRNQALHNKNGVLDVAAMKPLFPTVKKLVAKVLDEQEILENPSLTIGTMMQFLESVARKVNAWKEETRNCTTDSTPLPEQSKMATEVKLKEGSSLPIANEEVANFHGVNGDQRDSSQSISNAEEVNGVSSPYEYLYSNKFTSPQKDASKLSTECQRNISDTVSPKQCVTIFESTTKIQEATEINNSAPAISNFSFSLHEHEFSSEHTSPSQPSASELFETPKQVEMEVDGQQVQMFENLQEKNINVVEIEQLSTAFKSLTVTESTEEAIDSLSQSHQDLATEAYINEMEQAKKQEIEPLGKASNSLTTEEKSHFLCNAKGPLDHITLAEDELMDVDSSTTGITAHNPGTLENQDIMETEQKPTNEEDLLAAKEAADKAAAKLEQQRIKQERIDRERWEEQEARQVMEECLPIATIALHGIFKVSVEDFINDHLNHSNFKNLEKIYEIAFESVIQEHVDNRTITHKMIWKEFVRRLDAACKPKCAQILRTISKSLDTFNEGIRKKFGLYGYFTTAKLDRVVQIEYDNATKNYEGDEFTIQMIHVATKKLAKIYEKHNNIIASCENNYRSIAATHLTEIYHDQMRRYVQSGPYSPERLQRIHWKLVSKLIEAFTNACTLCNATDEDIPAAIDSFRADLYSLISPHKERNATKLDKLQKEISRIFQKMKDEYNRSVEEILTKHPDGLETRPLNKLRDEVQLKVMKLLELEIRGKVRENEPLDKHQEVLLCHIKSYWPQIVTENNKNLARKKEREETERQQRDAERKAQKLQEKFERKQVPIATVRNRSICSDTVSQNLEDNRPALSPLIFHLQPSRVVMAMEVNGSAEILKNEFGEYHTPGFIVWKAKKSTFIYGSEALQIVKSDQSSQQQEDIVWSMADFFMTNDLFWSRTIQTNGNKQRITTEFMLACLLEKLKREAELQMNGRCSITLIAIPFWLSSAQRVKVKDAAELASVSDVYLVNEASAAAYNFLRAEKREMRSNEILILSESLDRVDAFVYKYSVFGGQKRLRMVGHSSNYGGDDNRSKKSNTDMLGLVWKGLSYPFRYLYNYTSSRPNKSDEDQTTREVRKACKVAIEHSFAKDQVKESIYICENEESWGAILETVCRDFGRRASDIKPSDAVIFGAIALSYNPKSITNTIRDKLAFDICRRVLVSSAKVSVITKDTFVLPVHPQKFPSTLPLGRNEAEFYQTVLGDEHLIAKVKVQSYAKVLEPVLEITSESIIDIKGVKISPIHKGNQDIFVADQDITWESPNLSAEYKQYLSGLLVSVLGPPITLEDTELNQAKANLEQLCHDMLKKLDSGDHYKIRSDLVRNMVKEKIAFAKEVAEHSNTKISDINAQIDFLAKLEVKYNKK